jgi:AcrR family transcriptional regulator
MFGLVLAIEAYAIGWARLRRRERLAHRRRHRRTAAMATPPPWRIWRYAGGIAALVLALLSPIGTFDSASFFVHMIQHLLLALVAPPLTWLGAPLLPFLWTLPRPQAGAAAGRHLQPRHHHHPSRRPLDRFLVKHGLPRRVHCDWTTKLVTEYTARDMPRAFSERERDLIRRRLVQAGRRHFAAYGMRASVDDLVRAAGISKGAFYLFYESKEAVLLDVLEQLEAELQARLLDQVLAPGVSPRDGLRALLRQSLTIRQTDPLLRRLGPEELERLARRAPPERAAALLRADVATVARFLDRWRARGTALPVDAEVLAGVLRALFFASLHEAQIGPDVYPSVIDTLVDGVAAAVVPAGPTVAPPGGDRAPAKETARA